MKALSDAEYVELLKGDRDPVDLEIAKALQVDGLLTRFTCPCCGDTGGCDCDVDYDVTRPTASGARAIRVHRAYLQMGVPA